MNRSWNLKQPFRIAKYVTPPFMICTAVSSTYDIDIPYVTKPVLETSMFLGVVALIFVTILDEIFIPVTYARIDRTSAIQKWTLYVHDKYN